MNRPRILFVLRYHFLRYTGGAETQCWLLATEFARHGWDVHYVSETDTLPSPNPLEGVMLHGVPEEPSYWTGNRAGIRQLMADLQPDVVYSQVADLYSGHAMLEAPANAVTIWAAAADADGHTVVSLRNFWRANTVSDFFKRLPVVLHVHRVASQGMHKADIVIAQHEQQRQWFKQMGIESIIIRNHHPAVPDSQVQTHESTPLVLWVGSVKHWKRPEIFLDLVRRCSDLNARFVIVGQCYDDHYLTEMAELAREHPNFSYAGFVPFDKVGDYFAQAHLVISTSLAEGFPNTFVQAWIHGVPVISLDVNPENLLTTESLGRHVTSVAGLEEATRELVTNTVLRRELGHHAREFANREFNLQRNFEKIEGLLAERGVPIPQP